MKYIIVVFVIILSLVGFTLFSFVQDEVVEFQGTSEFTFNDSKAVNITANENADYIHRISYDYKNDSLLESIKAGDSRYISIYYYLEDNIVCEEFKYDENLEMKLTNKISGDLLISIPIYDEENWNISRTNVNHNTLETYKISGFNIYLIKSESSGYNKLTFTSKGKVIKLGYELVK